MGKKLIIKGADFSANGIKEGLAPVDITSLIVNAFNAQRSLNTLYAVVGNYNTTRCCINANTFASFGVDITKFSKIELNVKAGFDYVFGTGPVPGVANNWQGWSGSIGNQPFAWVTGNQKAEATVDATTLSFSANFRYDDNTTVFDQHTLITDIVDSIILYP